MPKRQDQDVETAISVTDGDTSPVLQISSGNLPARVGLPVIEVIVRGGLVSIAQVKAAQLVTRAGEDVVNTLIKSGALGEDAFLKLLSITYHLPIVSLGDEEIDRDVIRILPKTLAVKYLMVPLFLQDQTLTIAVANLLQQNSIHQDIGFARNLNVAFVLAKQSDIKAALSKYYGVVHGGVDLKEVFVDPDDTVEVVQDRGDDSEADQSAKDSEEAPIIKMVRTTLLDAIQRGASDIHIESYEKYFVIRFRIDGVLHDIVRPPTKYRNSVISRIKIMANLDITERRLPQDGRIRIRIRGDREVDFRVSVVPTLFGENIVLRILDRTALNLDLALLGFEGNQFAKVEAALCSPHGMILVTGPTGSGKTTTLYAALTRISRPDIKVLTAEDPVEMSIPGVTQVHIREDISLTFAVVLRSFLRQDPDIIMVGEIRDFETADIAVKAALTGHLVLSTLHTNDASSAINRLLSMGVEPYLVTSTVKVICAQRLVRKICLHCKVEDKVDAAELEKIGFSSSDAKSMKVYKGKGCDVCSNTGFKGRISCFEVLQLTAELREAIFRGASADELKELAVRDGMITLRQAGLSKVKTGITTIAEVLRVTQID